MKFLNLVILFFISPLFLSAQKNYNAFYADQAPLVDGEISDSVWDNAEIASDFSTSYPYFGQKPHKATEVRMIQTEMGLYVAVHCFSDKVRADGSIRDDDGRADYFSIGLDTWNDDQNAFVFTVTASGQVSDQRWSSNAVETRYDVPCKARVKNLADGWTAEMYIPFTSLRYSKHKMQDWGLQFSRFDRSSGEYSTWSPQDPLIRDQVLQYGQLGPLGEVKKKRRLALNVLSEISYSEPNGVFNPGSTQHGQIGVDASIGLNTASTLCSSLGSVDFRRSAILDNSEFGIARSLPEPRQLHAEESGIQRKAGFYSDAPTVSGLDVIGLIPSLTPGFFYFKKDATPLNTLKYSTRTRNNLGISVLNTIFSRPQYSEFDFTPSGAYNLTPKTYTYNKNMDVSQVSVEKLFANNSWLAFSNLNYYRGKGANNNIASLAAQLRDKSNHYQFRGAVKVLSYDTPNPGKTLSDVESSLALDKINEKWNWGISYRSPDKSFRNINNLTSAGNIYQRHSVNAYLSKQVYTPVKKWLNVTDQLRISSGWNVAGSNSQPLKISAGRSGMDTRFRQMSAFLDLYPVKVNEDFSLGDIVFKRSHKPATGFSLSFTSDSRKKAGLSSTMDYKWEFGTEYYSGALSLSPFVVLSPKLNLRMENYIQYNSNVLYPLSFVANGVEESDYLTGYHKLVFQFAPSPRFILACYAGLSHTELLDRTAYAIGSDGSLNPVQYSFDEGDHLRTHFGRNFGADAKWMLSAGSLIRVHVGYEKRSDRPVGVAIVSPIPILYISNGLDFSVSAILNLQ